ncbi:uncharacterized protein [Nicotiana tomentosiformis]|uniref:Protein TolB-like n=1 Tax=Nicotiana tabacum TaxID=4097 RepID=A0A1S3ZRA8_TOBAC|nr:uncharacterized protein LOC104109859 [Nicotiana tomentosiformis]XP_016466916.1 PREDICTED: uncharacterized protein LOC107789592 [Nicotiana tabacum]
MPNANTFHLPKLRRLSQVLQLQLYNYHFPAAEQIINNIMDSQSPHGSIIFSTVGRTNYGFDIFSLKSPFSFFNSPLHTFPTEQRLTDGTSVNFNGQFVDEDQTLVFVSERSGSPRIYLQRPSHLGEIEQLPDGSPDSPFLDRPLLRNKCLYYISAHQSPKQIFTSWSALYSTTLDHEKTAVRLTPYGCVDYSPAISQSGHLIAVASYGDRRWPGEFHDLSTDIVVFPESDPSKRTLVCQHGGWPTWSGDSTIYFHRQADDGWWSIFRVDLPEDLSTLQCADPVRVTPPGVHCFTPAAATHSSKAVIAIATRRPGKSHRHIEIFDVESHNFYPVTEFLNRTTHHYNPFFSPEATFLSYHSFRGESSPGDTTIPNLDPVISPTKGLRMLRLNGSFPSFSPSGDFIAFNKDFNAYSGLKIVKSDGSKRWTLFKGRTTFGNSWSPAEPNVILTSVGPVFDSVQATVQIARVSFDSLDLTNEDCAREIPVEIKVLTKEETGNNAFPSCSPDGKHVVFRSGRSGHKNLYIVDAVKGELEGGEICQLTEGPWIDTMPSWSPDGKLIAFSSNRHNPDNITCFSIYVVHPDGTGLRRIHVAGPEGSDEVDKERLNHVCFSKDCEWLLFTANLGGVTAEPVSLPNQYQPYGDLYLVKLDGSGLQRLTWNGYENGTPAWHPSATITVDVKRSLLVGDKLRGEFDDVLWMNC